MKGISAVLTIFNAADVLEACLAPLGFCDEIVIVDSGSTDGTQDIARRYTDIVEHRDWPGFKKQWEYAVSRASGPWILLLDQDEIVGPELARRIEALPDDTKVNGFLMRRYLYFMGRMMKYGDRPDWIVRLFRKDEGKICGSDTHPDVEVNGPAEKLKGPLKHYSYRNLEDYFNCFNSYTSLAAQERFESGTRFSFIQNFRVLYEFIMRYIFRLGFLDGYPGFVYALISSFYAWTKYTKLKELEDRDKRA